MKVMNAKNIYVTKQGQTFGFQTNLVERLHRGMGVLYGPVRTTSSDAKYLSKVISNLELKIILEDYKN